MKKEDMEKICEAVFEFTRLQLADFMWDIAIEDINDTANAVQQELQKELRRYVR